MPAMMVRHDGPVTTPEAGPSLQELLVGVEGLGLLRQLCDDDAATARAQRLDETRRLLTTDSSTSSTSLGQEYGLQDGYRAWAETYDRPLRLFWIEEPPMRRRIDRWAPGAALDAACGTGRYAAYLAAHGHEVVGVDMLNRARAKLPGSRFLEGQLTALPLHDGTVDAAVCGLALVHVPDLDGALRELARVVRPGGPVLISDVHPFLVLLGWQAQFPAPAVGASCACMPMCRRRTWKRRPLTA
jgi:SAM-dependent methyltransferase